MVDLMAIRHVHRHLGLPLMGALLLLTGRRLPFSVTVRAQRVMLFAAFQVLSQRELCLLLSPFLAHREKSILELEISSPSWRPVLMGEFAHLTSTLVVVGEFVHPPSPVLCPFWLAKFAAQACSPWLAPRAHSARMPSHVLGRMAVACKCMGMLEHALAMVAVHMFRPLGMVEALCLERVALVDQSTLRIVSAIVCSC